MSNPRYIDANAEIEKAKALLKDETIEHSSVADTAIEGFIHILEVAPTANVAPVRSGNWEMVLTPRGAICPECGTFSAETTFFCSHCGLKMLNGTV